MKIIAHVLLFVLIPAAVATATVSFLERVWPEAVGYLATGMLSFSLTITFLVLKKFIWSD